jgi:hypothetical protein
VPAAPEKHLSLLPPFFGGGGAARERQLPLAAPRTAQHLRHDERVKASEGAGARLPRSACSAQRAQARPMQRLHGGSSLVTHHAWSRWSRSRCSACRHTMSRASPAQRAPAAPSARSVHARAAAARAAARAWRRRRQPSAAPRAAHHGQRTPGGVRQRERRAHGGRATGPRRKRSRFVQRGGDLALVVAGPT